MNPPGESDAAVAIVFRKWNSAADGCYVGCSRAREYNLRSAEDALVRWQMDGGWQPPAGNHPAPQARVFIAIGGLKGL
jgi:hypothetical protein